MTATTIGKKLCWNCDGDVSLQAGRCPYCGVQLNDFEQKQDEPSFAEKTKATEEREAPARVPFSSSSSGLEHSKPRTTTGSRRTLLSPLLLLLPGVVFLLFSFVLFFFSTDGFVVLRWSASYWPYFLAPSLPLLYYGWKALEEMGD